MPSQDMVRTEHVVKVFTNGKKEQHVLSDVNLSIKHGRIFGIIGYSGAGKSTLVRCFNGIERPTKGNVFFEGQNIVNLRAGELRTIRRQTGMIFQQFNLMPSRTVFGNIALPLKHSGLSKQEINRRVSELLELVALPDKRNVYPAQLSGGQKQRVAIARALVNHPKILLCDEATSALDPKTTKSILHLLKNLNKELGLTIVVITHEMSVVREICHQVAVLDQGKIIEEGDVYSVFARPKQELTRSFIDTTSTLGNVEELVLEKSPFVHLEAGQLLLKMSYTDASVSESLISYISRTYDIDANIICGDIQILNGHPLGGLIVILSGHHQNIEQTLDYLKSRHVAVEVLNHG